VFVLHPFVGDGLTGEAFERGEGGAGMAPEFVGPGGCGFNQFVRRAEFIDEAEVESLDRVEHAPGEEDGFGVVRAGVILEHRDRTGEQGGAEGNLVERDFGGVVDHQAGIGGEGEDTSAGDRVAVDGGDERFGEEEEAVVEGAEGGEEAGEFAGGVAVHFGDIEAEGEEFALPGEDDGAGGGVVGESGEGVGQFGDEIGIDGIDPAPVEGDGGQAVGGGNVKI